MLEGLMRALKILKEEHLSNYEEELLMEDLVEKLEGEILNIIDLDCVLTEITSGSINNFLPY